MKRALLAGAVAATALTTPAGAAAHRGADPLRVTTTLGRVQPLKPADEIALYGHRMPAVSSWRRRGCRIARTRAEYESRGTFAYWLAFQSRFCWDKRRKRASQRGYQDTDYHIAPGFRWAFGYSVAEHGPVRPASSGSWRGGRRGMTHMNARFKFESGRPIKHSDWTVYLSQHGHWDGTMYDHQWSRK